MGKDLSTVLICSACKGTLFKEKKHDGSILLHCETCGGSAKVSKAGIGFAVVAQLQESGRVFPTAKGPAVKKEGQEKEVEFEIMEFRLPSSVKKLVQATLWTAKSVLGITGSWYGGAMLAHICADFLSGVDFSQLGKDDLDRIVKQLQEAAEGVDAGDAFAEWPAGFQASARESVGRVVKGPFAGLPKLAEEKKKEFEEKKREGYQSRVGVATRARTAKSFSRLEKCVRALDMQLREVVESGGSDDVLDRDYLDGALETGTGFLAAVKAGELTLSDPKVQRFMKTTEEKLGMKPAKDPDEEDGDD